MTRTIRDGAVHMKDGVTLVLNSLRSGGAEKQLLWIAREIVALGIPCNIFELAAGARTERIEAMVRAAADRGVRVLRAPPSSGNSKGLWRLRKHLAEHTPKLVWSWGLRADGTCYLAGIQQPSVKRIMSIRSANSHLGFIESFMRKLLARRADGIVSNTTAGIEMAGFQDIGGLRLWVLPNAVMSEERNNVILPESQPKKVVLVMLGNIKVNIKGYDIAAQLARIMLDKGLSFELRIAGRPDELARFEEICSRLEVQRVVKWYGEVSYPEEFLRGGHLFLLLSRYEGMPNTLLEALNVGLPVIATEVGDLRMLKNKGAPFTLIPIENAGAAAEAVENALAQWSETRLVASEGRSWVQKNYSEEACRAVLREILSEVFST